MVDSEILLIQKTLEQSIKPTEIFLFGSYANDTFTKNSDYDFYITVDDAAGDIIELTQKAYKSLRGIRTHPVDIIINYKSTYQKRKLMETLEKKIATEGVLLYAK